MIHKSVLSLILLVAFGFIAYAGQSHTDLSELGAIQITLPGQFHYELGTAVTGAGDFNGDGFLDVAIGAPSYDPAGFGNGYNNGAVFIVSGKTLDKTKGIINVNPNSFNGIIVIGRIQSRLGNAIASGGDVNADGFSDLAIGSEQHKYGYLIFGQKKLRQIISLGKDNPNVVEIRNTGLTVSSAGDFNGDGFADAIFGNPYSELVDHQDQKYHIGRVTLLYGGSNLSSVFDALIPNKHLKSIPGPGGALVGKDIAGGIDINCDGFSDILVVAPKGGRDQKGRTLLIYGDNTLGESVEYTFIIDQASRYVKPVKDANGDGFPDLLIGIENGSLLLWGGQHLKGTLDLKKNLNASWGTKIIGAQSAYGVGDLNGDGFGDIVVALPYSSVNDKFSAGRVIFLFGRPEWPEEINIDGICNGEFSVMDYIILDGSEAFGAFGSSVDGIGDIQGDGFEDVIIGAPAKRIPGETTVENPGSAYIIQGQSLFYNLQTYRSQFFTQKDTSR